MKPIFALALAGIVAGCMQTSEIASSGTALSPTIDYAAFKSAGATGFSWPELIEGGDVTVTYPNGVIVYDTAGNKTFTNNNGNVVARTWRQRSDGVYCETLVGSGEEVCVTRDENLVLVRLGNDLRQFDRNDGEPEFILMKTGRGAYAATEA